MVIIVRGTDSNNNKAAHITAMLAGMSSVKTSRKALVLQFNKSAAIEDLLIGKKRSETEIVNTGLMFEDTGIDALFRRVETQRISKEHFDSCCTPILNSENLLDIAVMSKKESFEEEMLEREEDIASLINQAKELYDDIYIYANSKNHELMDLLNKFAEFSVICIRQGNKEKVSNIPEKFIYLIAGYDKNSSFNIRYMRNLYKAKNMYYMPYSVEFKDAYNNGTMMNFLGKNEKTGAFDINFPLMDAMEKVLELYVDSKVPEEKEPVPMEEKGEQKLHGEDLEDFEEPDVEVKEKRRLFSKKTKKVVKETNASRKETKKKRVKNKKGKKAVEVEEDLDYLEEEEVVEAPKKKSKKTATPAKRRPAPAPVEDEYEEIEEEEDFEVDEDEELEELSAPKPAPVKIIPKATPVKATPKMDSPVKIIPKATPVKATPKMDSPVKIIPKAAPVKAVPQMESTAEEWECPECGVMNVKKFCLECGAKKPEPKVIEKEAEEWKCPECGESNPINAKFCLECGTKHVEEPKDWTCPTCGVENPANAKFCLECGTKK